MEVTTADKKIEQYAKNRSKAVKSLGKRRADKFYERLQDLLDANNLEELRYAPGHYHELVGDRKGQWACDLDQPYRLIFEPHEKPIPSDPNGKYIWIEIKGVELIEITNYHGK